MKVLSILLSILIHWSLSIILLLGVTNSTAASDFKSQATTTKINAYHPSNGLDFDLVKSSNTNESGFILPMTLIGFSADIYQIYKEIGYLLNPEIPKQTLEAKIEKVTQVFTEVVAQIKEFANNFRQKDVDKLHNVKVAIVGGIIDLECNTTIDVGYKAVALYDKLDFLVNGMLGNHTDFPDLLNFFHDEYQCGSRSLNETMEKFITLLNIGAVGISYYSTVLNNTAKFNGDLRIKTLSDKKNTVFNRLHDTIRDCATLNKTVVNDHISNVLCEMQNSTTVEVTQALYERFDDIYNQLGISWLFYAAWDFHPTYLTEELATHTQLQSVRIWYYGDEQVGALGVFGDIKIGGWSVYWVGVPPRNANVGRIKAINEAAVNQVVENAKWYYPRDRHAELLEKWLLPYKLVSFDSRKPAILLIVVNPPSSATFGHPLDQQLNVKGYRATTTWMFFPHIVLPIPYPLSVTVDIVVI